MTTNEPRCPDCGSTFTIDPQAQKGIQMFHPNPGGMPYIDTVLKTVPVAFCNGCERVVEL